MEVIADWDGVKYNCTVMPEDVFKIVRLSSHLVSYNVIINDSLTFNARVNNRTIIGIEKTKGEVSGNQEVCPIGSFIDVIGTYEYERTEGGNQWVRKIFTPFILHPFYLESHYIQEMRTWTHSLENTTSSTLKRISLKKGGVIAYPPSFKEVKVQVHDHDIGTSYACFVGPGDHFEIQTLSNYPTSYYPHDPSKGFMFLTKVEEAPSRESEAQEPCSIGDTIYVDIQNCRLTRTKDGVPESLNCESPFNTLNTI